MNTKTKDYLIITVLLFVCLLFESIFEAIF